MKPAVIAAAASLVAGILGAAPQPRPQVLVTFAVEAPEFLADLGDQKAACETAVAATAVQQLSVDFPFLEWVASGASDHKLVLTLKERQGLADVDTYLEYRGSDSEDPPPTHLLYPALEPRDRDDAQPVIISLQNKVKNDIRASSAELKKYFTSRVPIATTVEFEDTRIIVPVSGVHADSTSILDVRFVAANQPGEIRLRDAMEYAPRGIFCAVGFFSHRNITETSWSNAISTILTNQAHDIQVLMIDYRGQTYPDARNGTVTTFR